MKKATSSDVAALAGVSQTTVSLILNNSNKVTFSDETKEKVYAAARQLNYKLPVREGMPSNAKRKLIMVFTPTLANQYYTELIQSIEQYAGENGFRVISCNTFRKPEVEKNYLDMFTPDKIFGIIYTFLPSYPRMVEQLSQQIPVVMIGEKNDDLAISSIELSNFRAGTLIAEHLIELGHKHFAFLSTPLNNLTLAREQRLQGIRSKLKEFGLEKNIEVFYSDSQMEQDSSNIPFEYSIGYQLTLNILKKASPITAFIGVNDFTALGILSALRETGHSVPGEYSVCGFDNIFSTQICTPTMTTIDHHLFIRSKAAVDLIIGKLNDGRKSFQAPLVNKIEYQPQLVARESTGSAPIDVESIQDDQTDTQS